MIDISTALGILNFALKPLWEKAAAKAFDDVKGKDIRHFVKRLFVKPDEQQKFSRMVAQNTLDEEDSKFILSRLEGFPLDDADKRALNGILNPNRTDDIIITSRFRLIRELERQIIDITSDLSDADIKAGDLRVARRRKERSLEKEREELLGLLGIS